MRCLISIGWLVNDSCCGRYASNPAGMSIGCTCGMKYTTDLGTSPLHCQKAAAEGHVEHKHACAKTLTLVHPHLSHGSPKVIMHLRVLRKVQRDRELPRRHAQHRGRRLEQARILRKIRSPQRCTHDHQLEGVNGPINTTATAAGGGGWRAACCFPLLVELAPERHQPRQHACRQGRQSGDGCEWKVVLTRITSLVYLHINRWRVPHTNFARAAIAISMPSLATAANPHRAAGLY